MQNFISISCFISMLASVGVLISLVATQRRSERREKREKKETKKRIKSIDAQHRLDEQMMHEMTKGAIPAPPAPATSSDGVS